MKTLIFIVILAVGCWFLYGWLKTQSAPEKIQQDPMVRYTTSLQNDVKKAEAAIRKEVRSAQPTEAPAQ